jgi:hypothetical protein
VGYSYAFGFGLCPKTRNAGIENPKKNVWLNKSIYPLNKTFLLGKKAKNTFFTQEAKPVFLANTLKTAMKTETEKLLFVAEMKSSRTWYVLSQS